MHGLVVAYLGKSAGDKSESIEEEESSGDKRAEHSAEQHVPKEDTGDVGNEGYEKEAEDSGNDEEDLGEEQHTEEDESLDDTVIAKKDSTATISPVVRPKRINLPPWTSNVITTPFWILPRPLI